MNVMTNNELLNLLLSNQVRIAEAISTGSAWEIWMQVELIILLRQSGIPGIQAAREVPYPNQNLRLDALAQDPQGMYAIELKVESANNAGPLIAAVQQDILKIQNYPAPVPGTRWVVAIGYSNPAINDLNAFASNPANNAIYNSAGGIGGLVVTV